MGVIYKSTTYTRRGQQDNTHEHIRLCTFKIKHKIYKKNQGGTKYFTYEVRNRDLNGAAMEITQYKLSIKLLKESNKYNCCFLDLALPDFNGSNVGRFS